MRTKFKKLLEYFLLIILISSFSQSIAAEENFDKNYRKWQNLSLKEKKQLRRRYKTWKSLPREKRNEIIKAHKNFKNLPEKQKRILINKHKKWQSLSVEKKKEVISKRIERFQNLREKAIRSGNKNNAEKLNKRINVLKQMPNYRHEAGVRKQQKLPKQIRKDRAKTGTRQIAPKVQKQIPRVKREKRLNRKEITIDKDKQKLYKRPQKSRKKIQKSRQDKKKIYPDRTLKKRREKTNSSAGKAARKRYDRHKSRRPVHRKRERSRR